MAYYSALWKTSLGPHGSYSIPLVIDAPQQQGQDEENLPRMLKYIANDMPKDAQVILGIETPTKESFDQVVELDEAYHLLRSDEFEQVDGFVGPYLDAMFLALLAPESKTH